MTPTIQGETRVYLQDEQERELTVGTRAWFAWLETAFTFSFVSKEFSHHECRVSSFTSCSSSHRDDQ